MLSAARLALPLGHHPVLDADALARIGVRPAGDVAGGVDAGRAGLEIFVDADAAVDAKARLFGERQSRPHADADDDEIGGELVAALQRHRLAASMPVDAVLEMEDDAVLLVQRAHEVAELGAEHSFERPLLRRDDVHLDARARATRRRPRGR